MNNLSSQKETAIQNMQMKHEAKQIKNDKMTRNIMIFLAAATAGWGALSFENGPLAPEITEDDKSEIYQSALTQVLSEEVSEKSNELAQDFKNQVEAYINGTTDKNTGSKTLSIDFEDVVNRIDEKAAQMLKEKEDNLSGRAAVKLFLASIFAFGIYSKHADVQLRQENYNKRFPSDTPKP